MKSIRSQNEKRQIEALFFKVKLWPFSNAKASKATPHRNN